METESECSFNRRRLYGHDWGKAKSHMTYMMQLWSKNQSGRAYPFVTRSGSMFLCPIKLLQKICWTSYEWHMRDSGYQTKSILEDSCRDKGNSTLEEHQNEIYSLIRSWIQLIKSVKMEKLLFCYREFQIHENDLLWLSATF